MSIATAFNGINEPVHGNKNVPEDVEIADVPLSEGEVVPLETFYGEEPMTREEILS